jgi:taurine dioxygenase
MFEPGTEGLRSREHELLPRRSATATLCCTHPAHRETVLFVTDLHVEHIDGVDADTNDRLVDALLDTLYQPAHVYEHEWTVDDLVVWDNETLQHMRTDIANEKPRSFLRNTLHVAGASSSRCRPTTS